MTLGELIRAGVRAVRAWWRLLLGIYLAQLAVGLLMSLVVWGVFGMLYGMRPLFDQGVGGDAVALILSLKEHPGALAALIWSGLGMALGWALLSFYLTPGLLGVFAGRPFGDAARRGFWPFVRLFLWSLIPSIVALGVAALGVREPKLYQMVSRWDMVASLLRGLPGILLLALVFCAVDYARADLVAHDTRGAGRALLRAFRLVLTRPLPTLHYFLYCVSVVVLALAYLVVSRPLFGLLLFLVRQLFLGARFAARAATSAGQVELVRSHRAT
jgi:hypothetical protein